MAVSREKFSSQVSPELLSTMREIARKEGRHFQAVLEEAMREYIENRARGKAPRLGHGAFPGQHREKPPSG